MQEGEVLYRSIGDKIKERIEKGIYKEGDKIPSIRDLCKEFNVSNITIRQAISELINDGYLQTRGSKGTYVRRRKRTSSRLIATIFHTSVGNQFVGEIYSGIEKVLSLQDYHSLFLNTEGNVEKEIKYLKELLDRDVDGIIITPVITDYDSPSVDLLRRLLERGLPIVSVDIEVKGLNCDYVETDNLNAGYAAVEYLINKGHRKIGIILGKDVNTIRERFAGYKKALRDYKIDFNMLYVKRYTYHRSYEEAGYVGGLELLNLKDPPTAIFCTVEEMAIGLYKACFEQGLSIPEDISVFGFDNLSFSEFLTPPLTTVHQDKCKIGEEAAKLLISRIDADTSPPKRVLIPYRIIERDSVLDIAAVRQEKIRLDRRGR